MAHQLVMWWHIGWRCGGSLVGDVVAHGLEIWWLIGWRCGGSLVGARVGHSVLSRSERSGLSRSFKECSVLSHSFSEFLATYETQKNRTFFPVLFKRTEKNLKNGKERKDHPVVFSIYIQIYIYILVYITLLSFTFFILIIV